jgi:hypothetical protein
MKRILDPLPNPKILSLLLTLQCTAECRHCGTLSGPRVKSRLRRDIAERLITEAGELAYDSVVFTGGEPTLYGPDLYGLIELANKLSLPTRVVTNAHWAKDRDRARAVLEKFSGAGLNEINYSTGDEHAKYVPLANVIWGIRAALDVGMRVAVMIEVVSGRSITQEELLRDRVFTENVTEDERDLITFSESPWMPLDEKEIERYPPGLAANSENLVRRLGCDSVINTTTILSDGRVMACCGLGALTIPELEIGNVPRDSLQELRQRAEGDFLKRWIRNEGPERILQWAAGKNPEIRWENQYAHRCQACKRLYTDPLVRAAITEHFEEKILDVLYGEWLLHHYEQDNDAALREPSVSLPA